MQDQYLTHIFETMNALISANNMPGLKDGNTNSVYIVNYMQNNAFAQALTTDYKMRHAIIRDPEDKKLKMSSVDNQDEYGFDNTTDIKGAYRVLDTTGLSEAIEKIQSNLGKEVGESFIYECILGDKMYDWDQIEYNDKVEKVIPFNDLLEGMNESIRNYTLYGKEKAELIAEIKYGSKDMSTIIKEYKDSLLEFNISAIIDRVKQAIVNILTKLENAVKNCKDSGFKSVLLSAISKLKSLLTKSNSITSVEDANKISEEVNEIKSQLNDDTKRLFDECIKNNKILRLKILIKDSILYGATEEYISYIKSKGVDIFDPNAEEFEEPKYESLSKEQATDLFNEYSVRLVDNMSRHNIDILKKLRQYI